MGLPARAGRHVMPPSTLLKMPLFGGTGEQRAGGCCAHRECRHPGLARKPDTGLRPVRAGVRARVDAARSTGVDRAHLHGSTVTVPAPSP